MAALNAKPSDEPYYLSDLMPHDKLKGVDFIIHNMYRYPDDRCTCTTCMPELTRELFKPHHLTTIRRFFYDWTVDDVVKMVAGHVDNVREDNPVCRAYSSGMIPTVNTLQVFNRIISLNATEHSLVVVVTTEKYYEDFGDGFWFETQGSRSLLPSSLNKD